MTHVIDYIMWGAAGYLLVAHVIARVFQRREERTWRFDSIGDAFAATMDTAVILAIIMSLVGLAGLVLWTVWYVAAPVGH